MSKKTKESKVHRATVLIVDDNMDNLLVTRKAIESVLKDVEVVTLNDSETVMDYLHDTAVSVAILDVQMSGVNGIELCKLIKKSTETESVSVLLLSSGDPSSALKLQGFEAGADDFLTRPMDNLELAARVKVALRISSAESRLRRVASAAQQEYKTLFEKMVTGFAVHEMICNNAGKPVDYRFLAVNPAFEDLTTLKSEDIVGKTVLEVLPDTEQKWIKRYGRVVSTGETAHFEDYSGALDKHFEVTAFPVAENQFAVSFADITERKKGQLQLQLSKDLIDQSSDALFIIDAETGRFTDVNKQSESNLGYSKEELLELSVKDIQSILPDDAAWKKQVKMLQKKSAIIQEVTHKRKDGTVFPVEVSIKYVAHENGDYVVALARDVTERKKTEMQFRDTFEQSAVGIAHASCDGTFIKVNSRMCEITGYSEKELLAMNFKEITHPDDLDQDVLFVEELKAGMRESFSMEKRYIRKDGREVYVDQTVSKANDVETDELYFIGVIQDISARKSLESAKNDLQERLASAERSESLGILAGGVAHDLNNILGPIVLLPEMVDDVLADIDAASDEDITEARKDLEIIDRSARRATDVIKDLKALGSRGYSDLPVLDVNLLLQECMEAHEIDSLRHEYPGVEIASKICSESLLITGDKTDLHRVLLNLIINAVESIPKRGRVQVEIETVSLLEQKRGYEIIDPGDYVVIHVRDTGEGIPEEIIKRIFDPFVTSKKERSGSSGSGLGLSVVHSIIRDHKGSIDVASKAKKWSTTFSIYLPAATENAVLEEEVLAEGSLPVGDEHVLIVDDEPSQRFIAMRSLGKLGYKVSEAMNGQEAIKLFDQDNGNECPFDLILLDMIMEEGMDGLDTYQVLLKICPEQKVIIVSGHAESARARAAQELGADWLTKPYDIASLAVAVRSKLDAG